MIGTGAMCDPYLPAEKELQLTRKCLELIDRYEYGVTVLTKSNLVLRDLDLLQSINKKAKAVVQMTLTTYDEELCRKIEPHVSTTRERFEVLMRCKELGIPTLVWMTPILPFINDTRENIEGLLDYCLLAGVQGFWCSMLVSRCGKATGNISIRRWIVISQHPAKIYQHLRKCLRYSQSLCKRAYGTDSKYLRSEWYAVFPEGMLYLPA